jgi:hypothetical protein
MGEDDGIFACSPPILNSVLCSLQYRSSEATPAPGPDEVARDRPVGAFLRLGRTGTNFVDRTI